MYFPATHVEFVQKFNPWLRRVESQMFRKGTQHANRAKLGP